jgi:hypothetical protein
MDDIPFMEGDDDIWVLNYTHQPLHKPQPKKKSPLEERYEEYLKESDVMFNYMIEQYEIIFENETIRDFYIYSGTGYISRINEELDDNHGPEIQKLLGKWIENERQNGDLFNKVNWKAFHYWFEHYSMYISYNKYFKYKQYYLKLALGKCYIEPHYNLKGNKYLVSFGLILDGWKEDQHEMLQPENRSVPAADDIIPDYYWNKDVIEI